MAEEDPEYDKDTAQFTEDEIEQKDLYDQAREMTEQALEAYAQGDKETGDQLIEEAREVSLAAVQDIYEELEEDADSEHDPAALNDDFARDEC